MVIGPRQVKGAYAWDVDGNKYIDYVGSWGPAIVGHADDEVVKALQEVTAKGKSIGQRKRGGRLMHAW